MDSRHERYQSLIKQIEEHSISKEELKSAIEAADFDNEQLQQLYLAAVMHLMSIKNLSLLSIIPEPHLTHDICLAAVKINALTRYYLPKNELKNYDILVEIVRHDGGNLEKVPPTMRDLNMCLVAASKGTLSAIEALPFVPEAFLEQDNFKTALARCRKIILEAGSYLQFLPPSLRDIDICIVAVKQDWKALEYVPAALLEHEEFKEAISQFHEAIKKGWEVIHKIPPTLITQDDCMAAIKSNKRKGNPGDALKYIPKQFRNHDLLKKAASHSFAEYFLPFYLKNYQTETALSKDECESLWFEMIRHIGRGSLEPPKELLTLTFCQKIIKEKPEFSSRLLEYLQDYTNASVLNKQEYREIILGCVKQQGSNLRHVPVEMRDYEICMESVKNNGLSLEIIQDYERATTLNADQFKSICIEAIAQDARALDYVPVVKRDIDFCLALVRKSTSSLEHIQDYQKTTALKNEDEFRLVCQTAISYNPKALDFTPNKFLTADFIIGAIEVSLQGKGILRWISEHEDSTRLRAADYLKIAIAAVENDTLALEHVDEKLKPAVIDVLTPQKILSMNMETIIFFPANPEYTTALDQLLTDVKNVVVAAPRSFYDKEVRDAYQVYANLPQRAGKTLFVTTEKLNDLLTELKTNYPDSARQINLVLLGHANTASEDLAGIGADDITQLLNGYDNISRVTLLGCNTAKSLKPEQEKTMIKKYSDESSSPKGNQPCSVILMSRMPAPDEYPVLLARMSIDSKKRESDRACILVKSQDKGNEHYDLIYIQKNPDNKEQIIERKHTIEPVQLAQLGKVIGKKDGTIPFPGKNKPAPLYYRGGKGSEFLTHDEFQKITDITHQEAQQFTKGHSQYKKHKSEYPFLTSFELSEAEEAKIMPSLLKIFVDAIKSDPGITRKIVVKGYTKPLHVDTLMGQMTAASTHLYSSEYQQSKIPFFSKEKKRKDTIDRGKLKDEHKKEVADMQAGKLEGETSAKAIKVVINPKLK